MEFGLNKSNIRVDWKWYWCLCGDEMKLCGKKVWWREEEKKCDYSEDGGREEERREKIEYIAYSRGIEIAFGCVSVEKDFDCDRMASTH